MKKFTIRFPGRAKLNAKLWERKHLPLPANLAEETQTDATLKADLLRAPSEEDAAEYYALDRAIRNGEIDGIEAMTVFLQVGFNGFSKQEPWELFKNFDKHSYEGRTAKSAVKKYGDIGDRERVRRGIEAYDVSFDADPEKHVPLAPKSALLMPPKLTDQEREVARLVKALTELTNEAPKIKPAFAKKIKAADEGAVRVVFDAKGKMKKVKEEVA